MSDGIRRLMEEQERMRRLADPFGDLRRQADAFRQLGIGSATMDFLRQEEERRRLLASLTTFDIGGVAKAAAEFEHQRKLLEGPIEEARRLGLLDPNSEIRKSFSAALEARQTYEQMFRSPGLAEMERLAREAFTASQVAREFLGAPSMIQSAMEEVRSPWLSIAHEVQSARAFADIVGIGRGIGAVQPYDVALVEALRPSLGDWRDEATPAPELIVDPVLRTGFYHERGVDPALTAFTQPAFD